MSVEAPAVSPRRLPPPPKPRPGSAHVQTQPPTSPRPASGSGGPRTLPTPPPRSRPAPNPPPLAQQQSSPALQQRKPPPPRPPPPSSKPQPQPQQSQQRRIPRAADEDDEEKALMGPRSASVGAIARPSALPRRGPPPPPPPAAKRPAASSPLAQPQPPPVPTAPKPQIRRMHTPPSTPLPPPPPPPVAAAAAAAQTPKSSSATSSPALGASKAAAAVPTPTTTTTTTTTQQKPARRRSLSFGDEAFAIAMATASKPVLTDGTQDDSSVYVAIGSQQQQEAALLPKVGSALVSLFKKSRDDSGFPPRTSPPTQPSTFDFRADIKELVEAIRGMAGAIWDAPDLVDYWSSRPLPVEAWNDGYAPKVVSLVDLDAVASGWRIESEWDSVTHTSSAASAGPGALLYVLDADADFPWYGEFFVSSPHSNYVSTGPEGAPFIVSIEQHTRPGVARRAIVRSKKDDRRVLLPPNDALKALEQMLPQLKEAKLTKIKSEGLMAELKNFEVRSMRPSAKFGVLYVRPGLRVENEIYGAQSGSPAYEEFLEFIGERVQLQGFDRYRGGLDVKSNNTGTHSVYTTFQGYEIMFHVCTLLPYVESDVQKVDRKRHIGNDVSVIVFKDQTDPSDTFPPQILTSHFIHCVLVVTPELDASGHTTHYRLTVANKPGVPPYPPYLTVDARYEKTPFFRNILLAKLLNGGRAALASAEFSSLVTARKDQLKGFIQDALKQNPTIL